MIRSRNSFKKELRLFVFSKGIGNNFEHFMNNSKMNEYSFVFSQNSTKISLLRMI